MAVTTTTTEVRSPHRTAAQRAAQIFGWGFILAGLAGFFATGTSMESHSDLAPRLLGIWPVNMLHNVVHLALGIFGIMASKAHAAAKTYCVVAGVAYLALMGLALIDHTTFGLMPIGNNDIWLHALFGIPLLLIGLASRRRTDTVVVATETPRRADEVVYTDTTRRTTP
ncbi:MAG TPA: DUF4383 domain-containing protein [Gemmatimonadaceae bacterium]|nr:DUF4383 domain-containing protein [Gemmatimonadaceae bacterium]